MVSRKKDASRDSLAFVKNLYERFQKADISSFREMGPVEKREVVVGELDNDLKRMSVAIDSLQTELMKECDRLFDEHRTSPPTMEATGRAIAFRNRSFAEVELATNIFWTSVRERFNLWDNNGPLGLREGGKVVRVPDLKEEFLDFAISQLFGDQPFNN
jgi:hypothetical protein